MTIRNFDFPGVTLNQVFESQVPGNVPVLGVLCVGPQYAVHRIKGDASDPLLAGCGGYFSGTALTADIPGRNSANEFDADTCRLVIRDCWASYGKLPNITVSTDDLTQLDTKFDLVGESPASGLEAPVRVGDKVIVYAGEQLTSSAAAFAEILNITPGTDGKMSVLHLSVPVPKAATVTLLPCTVGEYELDSKSGAFTVDAKTGKVTVEANITVPARVQNATVQKGKFYLEYRERSFANVGKLGSAESLADLTEQLGEACAANPLALACSFAVMASRGSIVYYTAVGKDTPEDYVRALDSVDRFSDLYSVVPCTEDPDVIRACLDSCKAISDNEDSVVRRALWYGITGDSQPEIRRGAATYDTSKKTVTFTEGLPVSYKEGDRIRIYGTEGPADYTVTEYADPGVYTIEGTSLPTASSVSAGVIRTDPDAADVVADVIARRCTQSERAVCVWADGLMFNGEELSNYPLAAAAAGMRAYEPVHRPLSNLGYWFFTLTERHGLGTGHLKQIGSNGIWIVATNDDFTPVNKRQVTTAMANNINLDEESVISNVDSIAMRVALVGRDMVGNSNISDAMLLLLKDSLSSLLDTYTLNDNDNPFVGPQLTDWTLRRIWQDPVSRDRVYADFDITPPKPFNKFHMTMRVI